MPKLPPLPLHPPNTHLPSTARVRILNVFEPCTLQLGDLNYYSVREGDTLLSCPQWEKMKASYTSITPEFAG